MTVRTPEFPGPTEYEIETRGMAKAVDLLSARGQSEAAHIVLCEVGRRISKSVDERSPEVPNFADRATEVKA